MAFAFFHGLVDVTLRFFEENYGSEGLRRYLQWIADNYYADVAEAVGRGGLGALAGYLAEVAEDECRAQRQAAMEVDYDGRRVVVDVARCPAFVWLESNGREACEQFCLQCRILGQRLAEAAGAEFHLDGGRGKCRQVFVSGGGSDDPQP